MKRCAQCWRERPRSSFLSRGREVQRCRTCRRRYRFGAATKPNRAGERRGLRDRVLRVRWVALSQNKKLGGMPASITSGATCPPSCSFFGAGCYAEFHLMRHWWNETGKSGLTWRAFLRVVRGLALGTLWRHNEAGDLPGFGDELDVLKLRELVEANRGRRGFTFTHKPLRTKREREAVRDAVRAGFVVNLSADSLKQADELAELGVAPVAVVLPSDSKTRGVRTPAGRPVVVCPAQTRELTCAECQVCARPKRASVVGFIAHGQARATVNQQLVQLRLPGMVK